MTSKLSNKLVPLVTLSNQELNAPPSRAQSHLSGMFFGPGKRQISPQQVMYHNFLQKLQKSKLEYAKFSVAVDLSSANEYRGGKYWQQNLHKNFRHGAHQIVSPYRRLIELLSQCVKIFDPQGGFTLLGYTDSIVSEAAVDEHNSLQTYDKMQKFNQKKTGSQISKVIYRIMEKTIQEQTPHILVILSAGSSTELGLDIEAIKLASQLPIAIFFIGIGSGPFRNYFGIDNQLHGRRFINFAQTQFEYFQFNEYNNLLLQEKETPLIFLQEKNVFLQMKTIDKFDKVDQRSRQALEELVVLVFDQLIEMITQMTQLSYFENLL